MSFTLTRIAIIVLTTVVALSVYQCATPTQPTGGPADRTPPEIEETEPATGTTMFDGDRIRFHFTKYINRNSFRDAFQMEPDLDIDYEISWRRHRATVSFNDPLPDTTTIIFTLGTELADTRNNRIPSPIQLALSTGPEIDEGRITAVVKDAETGESMAGERVVLYRYPVDLSVGADYVGEADTAGQVRFNYLREGRYKGFWLDDRNRNRRWDPPRESAQPFPTDTLVLEKEGEADLGKVFVVQKDTMAPLLQAVGMLSEVRLRLRFSEAVEIGDDVAITVFREDQGRATGAVPLFVDAQNPNILLAQALDPLPDDTLYHLELQGVTDASGNEAALDVETFPGSDEPDTSLVRYIANDTRRGVATDEPIVIRYSTLLDQSPIVLDSLVVVESEDAYRPWPHAETRDNLLYIYPDGEWRRGEDYEIRVWDASRSDRRTIQPRILYDDELGDLAVRIEEPRTDSTEHRLQLLDEQADVIRQEIFLSEMELQGIPAGRYTLKVYELREGFREWDPGRVDPFRPPAPFFIQRNVPVERNMTGQVSVEWP
ncbi:MAG: Ig-like domain-containing protein [Cyclonatronaceae bacterium]